MMDVGVANLNGAGGDQRRRGQTGSGLRRDRTDAGRDEAARAGSDRDAGPGHSRARPGRTRPSRDARARRAGTCASARGAGGGGARTGGARARRRRRPGRVAEMCERELAKQCERSHGQQRGQSPVGLLQLISEGGAAGARLEMATDERARPAQQPLGDLPQLDADVVAGEQTSLRRLGQ